MDSELQREAVAELMWRQFLRIWDELTAEHSVWEENPEVHDRWLTRADEVLALLGGS